MLWIEPKSRKLGPQVVLGFLITLGPDLGSIAKAMVKFSKDLFKNLQDIETMRKEVGDW